MVKSVLVILTILGCIIWSMEKSISKTTSPINITDGPVIDTGKPIDYNTYKVFEEFFGREEDFDIDYEAEIDKRNFEEEKREEEMEKELENMFIFRTTDPTLQEEIEYMNRVAFMYESMMAEKSESKTNNATSVTSTVVPTTEPTAEPTVVPTTKPTTANDQNPMLNI